MNTILYLYTKQLKNKLLSLKKKKGMLILYIFLAIFVVFSLVFTIFSNQAPKDTADERIIYLFLAGFGLMYLYIFVYTGLSTGSTLFTLSDVGLLFVAPISPRKILNYGLLKSLGKTVFSCLFILYQMVNLKTHYGYGLKEISALLGIFVVLVFFCQLLSIGVYMYTNQNEKRKIIVKAVLYLSIFALLAGVLLYQRQQQCTIMQAFLNTVDSKWFGFFPIAGWSVMFFSGVINGSILSIFIALLCFTVFIFLIICLFMTGNADYYEDVLRSTENNYKAIQDYKDGKIRRQVNKKVKVKKEDSSTWKGNGGVTLYIKHKLEMKRESRFLYIDSFTLFLTIGVAVASRYVKVPGAGYIMFGALVYYQYIMSSAGKIKIELQKHYIYMIPEKSNKKVFYASITSIYKYVIDAVIIFGVMAICGGEMPLTCLFFAFAYISTGALFTGTTILYQRILQGQPSLVAKMMIGMVLMMMFLVPGIIASVFVGSILPEQLVFMSMLPFTLYCLLFAFMIFMFSGNLIDKSEYGAGVH